MVHAYVSLMGFNICGLLFISILQNTKAHESVHKRSADHFQGYDWLEQGKQELHHALHVQNNIIKGKAKNAILYIGDGLGVSTTSATRLWRYQQGQLADMTEAQMAYEKFPHVGVSMTYNTNAMPPDSAGTATAILSGQKTRLGVIGTSHAVEYEDCESSLLEENRLVSIFKHAQDQGKLTGIVTNTRLTHATPASAYAHSAKREWESSVPGDAGPCLDIATQLVIGDVGRKIKVILGGGRKHFLPNTTIDPEYTERNGSRKDDVNLIEKWLELRAAEGLSPQQYRYVWEKEQFDAVDTNQVENLLGIFDVSHMQYAVDRETDGAGEPVLTEMVSKAISILEQNQNGYLLLVEGGRIDHAHHKTRAQTAMIETVDFSDAVEEGVSRTDPMDTLIITSADHSHVFTIGGYSSLDNDVLGVANDVNTHGEELAMDGKHMLTLGYQNGPGYLDHRYNKTGMEVSPKTDEDWEVHRLLPRSDPATLDYGAADFRQDTGIPLEYESHGGEDVTIHAQGPHAHLIHKTHEQSYIAHVLMYAMCIGEYRQEYCHVENVINSASVLHGKYQSLCVFCCLLSWIVYYTNCETI